jgi:alpha-N-arabinofuranosidase
MKYKQFPGCVEKLFVVFIAAIFMNGFSASTLSVNVGGASTNVLVNKEIFGVLMERLGRDVTDGIYVGTGSTVPNTNGMRTDIINGFKECGCGAIQYPGGCAANSYAWNPPNPANDIGTDRFFQLCSLTTCQPILAGQMSSNQATSNKNWVTYINNNTSGHPWTLKYFQIGNEVWGCGGNLSGWAAYKPNYDANYNALHPPINGKQLYFIAGTALIGNNTWLINMLADSASRKDNVEIHDYIYFPSSIPGLNFTTAQYYNVLNLSNEGQIRPRLDTLTKILDTYDSGSTHSRLRIWEGEWGCWLENQGDGWQQWGTLMEGLSAGEHLNLFIRYSRRMMGAGLAQAINVIHSLFNTEANGTAQRMVKTATFYVFKMYIPHHSNCARCAPTTLTSEAATGQTCNAVSAAATVDTLRNLNLSLTNIDLTATRTVTITLTNTTGDPPITSGQIVTGPAMNSYNNYGATETVNMQTFAASNYSKTGTRTYSVNLPPMSVVMLSFTPVSGTQQPGAFQKNRGEDAFSIRSGSKGTVLISSSVSRKTPVTISLYGVDGRTLIDRVTRTFEPGNSACVLGNNGTGRGVYIVKITGADVNLTKEVVVAR